MADVDQSTVWGSIVAGVGGLGWALFEVRKRLRKDGEESSASEVVVTANGAVKEIIDRLKEQIADMRMEMKAMAARSQAEINVLSSRVSTIFRMHEQCQLENQQLRLEVDKLKAKP